ncbi:MAG: hypothetical protein QOK39_642 [Acidimicrobiaceae bacterium]|nr:hypothetical protein [Acidimicrobiaceae bacterium]
MTEHLPDNCRRCGAALPGAEASQELCRQCRANEPAPNRAAPQAVASGGAEPAWFLVRWEIDLETTSAEEAARAALAIQRNPASIATFFTVRPHDNPDAEIELDLLDDDAADLALARRCLETQGVSPTDPDDGHPVQTPGERAEP